MSVKGSAIGAYFAVTLTAGCRVRLHTLIYKKITTMAKVTSTITLQGTYDGITYVKSSAYGNHIRAKRGTHKKAVLNPGWEKQNKKLVRSNIPAKIIKDAINPYRKDFYDGNLWTRLISMTNEQDLDDGQFDFAKLRPFEIHKAYPLARLLNVVTNTNVDRERSELQVSLTYNIHPDFDESLTVDGYRFGVIAIFPGLENNGAKTEAVYSDIIERTGNVVPLHMRVPVPSGAQAFLICVRVDGYKDGGQYGTLASKGMKMVEAGKI